MSNQGFSQGHALLIGVGSYEHDPRLNVPATVADAEALNSVILDQGLCGYPAAQVSLLTRAAATRAGILAALDRLAQQTTEDATVLLFYAGHGGYGSDGVYYLTSHDSQVVGGKVVPGTGVG